MAPVLPPPAETKAPAPVETPRGRLLLEASDCCVRYQRGTEDTVKGATLRIYEGDRVALLGPSGCGKTTFLRALEGSLEACCGRVERHGFAVLIYQDLRLVSELSVLRNVCAGAYKRLGTTGGVIRFPREVREQAMELLQDLGLAELAHRRVGSLSGGQRQRVAIARALCSDPAVLLADEPLAALDPDNAERTLQLLDRLERKYGFAIVASTHNREVVTTFFDRAYRLDGGELREVNLSSDRNGHGQASGLAGFLGIPELENCDECVWSGRCEEPAKEAPVTQDPANSQVPGWWRVLRAPLALAVVVGLLVWSASALRLGSTDLGGAMSGLQMFLRNVVPGSWAEVWALPWRTLFWALVEMIQMAIVGTMVGLVISMPLAVMAARDTSPQPVRLVVRLFLNMVRTIPSIIWGLLFVAIVGIGPLAGVLALGVYSVGYLTKFFYEALENVDNRPGLALRALGASRLQSFLAATLRAAKPAIAAACFFVFEYNIRSASVLGVVGAGGIGQHLSYYIEWRNFPAAAAGILLVLVVVVFLDSLSMVWRRRLASHRGL